MPRALAAISQLEPMMEPKILSQPQLRVYNKSTTQNESFQSDLDIKPNIFTRRKKTHAAEVSYLSHPKLDAIKSAEPFPIP